MSCTDNFFGKCNLLQKLQYHNSIFYNSIVSNNVTYHAIPVLCWRPLLSLVFMYSLIFVLFFRFILFSMWNAFTEPKDYSLHFVHNLNIHHFDILLWIPFSHYMHQSAMMMLYFYCQDNCYLLSKRRIKDLQHASWVSTSHYRH